MKVTLLVLLLTGIAIPVNAQDTRTVLLVIDDLHISFRETPALRTMIKRLGAEAIRPDDQVAIVWTGPSSLSIPLTTAEQIQTVANRISDGGMIPVELVGPAADAATQRSRARTTRETLVVAVRKMAALGNRSVAVWLVSEGYPESVDPDTVASMITEVRNVGASISTYEMVPRSPEPPEMDSYRQASRQMLRRLAEATGGSSSSPAQ